jgi:polar amino acid transport system substrate-binding protein
MLRFVPSLRWIAVTAVGVCMCLTLTTAHAQTAEVATEMAPTGRLRVGVYPGSPLSMMQTKSGETRGLSFDLGRELARRLNLPVDVVPYSRIAEVIVAMRAGAVDFTVTNASPSRREIVDFTDTLISIELGYLVPAGSKITALSDIDRADMRVGVTQGSTSEQTLGERFAKAVIFPAPSLKAAAEMISQGQLDAFATNKPILFQMAEAMPGARVLDGRWGVEHIAVALPMGRSRARDYLKTFVLDVQRSGLLAQLTDATGLRGAVLSK